MAATASRRATCVALALALGGCETVSGISQSFLGGGTPEGQPGYITGFIGGVVADEPRAALTGREVLSAGGNAADAAVAMGFALAVTLPSRAGLGGGGACVAYSPPRSSAGGGVPEAVLFTSVAPRNPGSGDRPAAVPMLARGLFALHARYGHLPFEALIGPAERLARFGVSASRAFTTDLATVAGPLLADPNARAAFSHDGTPLTEGQQMIQPDLGGTLAQLRVSGVGDLYQGTLARRLEEVSPLAGGALTVAEMREALPSFAAPVTIPDGNDQVSFTPPPADGGLAAAAALQVLEARPDDVAGAQARAIAVASRFRAGGGDPAALLASPDLGAGALPPLPASTTFATLDRDGNAVACAVTMGNLFGTGRVAPGLGFLLAASPRAIAPPLLAAGIVWNRNLRAFRAAVGGSGQEGAALAAAVATANTLRTGRPMPAPVPEPGRANVIACARYLPGSQSSCAGAADPRGAGLAASSN
jgi:gamma-glutamyltranspeptidase/glutathione hydrolase